MPQLNPAPWFTTFTLAWGVFLTIVPPKVLAYIFPNKPALKGTEEALKINWTWPWQ